MKEKRERRWARLRRRFKVTLGENASFTVDVSGGGFSAQLIRVLAPGTLVEGSILVQGKALPYAGRVVWAKAGDGRLGIPGRIGVEFTKIDSALLGILGSHSG